MDKIMELAKKYNLMVIEDAAQGIMSTYKGKALGTFGEFGCFSFHETKNFSIQADQSVQVETASTRFATGALAFGGQGDGAVTAQLTGGIVASQDLQSNGGAVSLTRHVHTGVQAGSDTTASPVGG